jgi:hypothetical protein
MGKAVRIVIATPTGAALVHLGKKKKLVKIRRENSSN